MIKLLLPFFLVCSCISTHAQTNFVKNPSFEEYTVCPEVWDKLTYAKSWRGAIDSNYWGEAEYYNVCGNTFSGKISHVPDNASFYQFPRTGNGMAGGTMFYSKTSPSPPIPLPYNYRDYIQGHFYQKLDAGKVYCVSFWVNTAEASGRSHNKIGVYIDDGNINTLADTAGEEITSVTPQIFTNTVITDTSEWIKIEGAFVAIGNEIFITIGNFFTNSATTTIVTNYRSVGTQYSYYLIDDVSVIPIDLAADAGKDSHAEVGKKTQIGRVGDTTATALDCKWYKKGVLIDSGAIISVNAGATVGAVDTYVVVQTICGLVKTDTVTVKTVPLDLTPALSKGEGVSVWPNPSNGSLTITPHASLRGTKQSVKVYDLLGRVVYQNQVFFSNNQTSLHLNVADGVYILELNDSEGNSSRQRIEVRN